MRKFQLEDKVVLADDCDYRRLCEIRWELRDSGMLHIRTGGQVPWFITEYDRRILRNMSMRDYILLWKLRHNYDHGGMHLYVSGDVYDNRRSNVMQYDDVPFDPFKRWVSNSRFPGVYPSRNHRKKFDARVYWGGAIIAIKAGLSFSEAVGVVVDFYAHNRDCVPYYLIPHMERMGIEVIGQYFRTPHKALKRDLEWTDARTKAEKEDAK